MKKSPSKKPIPANKAKDGPAVIDAMQETVTLDRFFDRNPWKGSKAVQLDYVKRTVARLRSERAMRIAKGDKTDAE